MKIVRTLGLTVAAVAVLALATPAAAAQGAPAAKPVAKKTYEFEDVAHLSCSAAWAAAEKNVDNSISMIETLLGFLLESRGQAFPDTKEAGAAFGTALDKSCRADPSQLFLAAIDAALRQVVK
jgi:hypothetical protein